MAFQRWAAWISALGFLLHFPDCQRALKILKHFFGHFQRSSRLALSITVRDTRVEVIVEAKRYEAFRNEDIVSLKRLLPALLGALGAPVACV